MPSLTIPNRYHRSLREIRRLSDEGFGELVAALATAPPSPVAKEIVSGITTTISGIDPDHLTPIIEAVLALYFVRAQAEAPLDGFIGDVITAWPDSEDLVARGESGTSSLKKRLETLLSIVPLGTVAKAVNLRSEYAETFCSARVLTDLRPVWGQSDPPLPPIGAIVTHMLKLEYHHGTAADHRELYVALDSNDIVELIRALQRAQKKEESLKDLMNKAKVSDLKG
jgi:hypothetical protein